MLLNGKIATSEEVKDELLRAFNPKLGFFPIYTIKEGEVDIEMSTRSGIDTAFGLISTIRRRTRESHKHCNVGTGKNGEIFISVFNDAENTNDVIAFCQSKVGGNA